MRGLLRRIGAVAVVFAAPTACSGDEPASDAQRCDGKIDGRQTLTAWFHAGAGDEPDLMQELVAEFNESQSDVTIEIELLPENRYNELIEAAAAAGNLPPLLDFDGPYLPNLVYDGALLPLDSCVPPELKADLLPSIVEASTVGGLQYSVGAMGDGALGLYARRSALEQIGARIPAGPEDTWTAEEFTEVLERLRAAGYERPLDIKVNYRYGTEFFTYAFSPVIQSAGADLVDRTAWRADGTLNSPAAVEALTTVQGWSSAGYIDPNDDDQAFTSGRSAISWVGHWEFGRYTEAVGDDLLLLPVPRFGPRMVTVMGSWQWGLTTNTEDMDAGWAFLEFLMGTENQLRWIDLTFNLPATRTAAEAAPQFEPGGPERLFYDEIIEGYAVPRPQTPGYPVISRTFSTAFGEIMDGADVQLTLDDAAELIDDDMRANDGYAIPSTVP